MGAIQRARDALMQWIAAEYHLQVFEPNKNSARVSLKAMLAAVLRVRPPAKIANNTIRLVMQGNCAQCSVCAYDDMRYPGDGRDVSRWRKNILVGFIFSDRHAQRTSWHYSLLASLIVMFPFVRKRELSSITHVSRGRRVSVA